MTLQEPPVGPSVGISEESIVVRGDEGSMCAVSPGDVAVWQDMKVENSDSVIDV